MSRGFDLIGPAGRLEALSEAPVGERVGGAVVGHPHPLRGGTMHTTIVYRSAKALAAAGFEVVRFNFRGVGSSAGVHDEGRGEQDDYRAALDHLEASGARPVVACGFSFGGVMALRVGLSDPRVCALVAIGLPLRIVDPSFLSECRKPLLVVQGEDDPFGAPAEIEQKLGGLIAFQLHTIAGVGHFFEGKATDAAAAVAEFSRRHALAAAGSGQ